MIELSIRTSSNGFILWHHDEEGRIEEVIEDRDDELEAMARMLEKVAEYFGYQYDKFGSENLEISFTGKGHKVD